MNSISFSQQIVQWYHQHGRKHLPWQASDDGQANPYHVWLSEIMLQQTQVIKVMEYFDRFVTALPTLEQLATADEQTVLALWSGLGYYNRARNLHRSAQLCMRNHNGELPASLTELMALPGIGRSTAAAIASLAFGLPEPIMDGNVKRVFARHFLVAGEPNKSSTLKQFWALAEAHRAEQEPAAYTQGLMDLGATVCTKYKPQCEACPISSSCQAKSKGVIDKYPEQKKQVVQKEVDLHVLLCVSGDDVGLWQRDDQHIWPNLWFLPTYNSQTELLRQCSAAQHQFSLTHKLTHRILQLHVYLPDSITSASVEDLKLHWIDRKVLSNKPHPKALNHLLRQHDNH